MEGIQGAVLGVKLKHLDTWTSERRRVAARYHDLLKDTPLQLPREAAWAESAYHLYVVRHPRRDELKSTSRPAASVARCITRCRSTSKNASRIWATKKAIFPCREGRQTVP